MNHNNGTRNKCGHKPHLGSTNPIGVQTALILVASPLCITMISVKQELQAVMPKSSETKLGVISANGDWTGD